MKKEFEGVPQYLRLANGGSPARLAILREMSARAKADKLPPSRIPADWRAAREWNFTNWRAAYCAGLNPGFNGDGFSRKAVWYSHGGEQFRGEKFADQCEAGPDNTGWYTDMHSDGLARGIVARLSHGRFIAGYWWGDNGERVYFSQVFTDESDAARMADEHARVFAEGQQEDNAKFERAKEIEGEIEQAACELGRQFALRHHYKFRADARESIPDLLETVREKRAELARDYSDYV